METPQATLSYDVTRNAITVEWPWFKTETFRLTKGDDAERLAAALTAFHLAVSRLAKWHADSSRHTYTDVLALRHAVETATSPKVRKFDEKGKLKLTLEELFDEN